MALTHNSTIADSEPAWSSVDKTALPRSAFADHGEEGVKSTWKYPHHWVQGGGDKDDNGIYTSGTMYLHTGGWQAAINAAHGARSGQSAGSGVTSHLEEHRGAVERHREQKSKSYLDVWEDTPQCWANHMGIWVIDSMWMQMALVSIQSGMWNPIPRAEIEIESSMNDKPYRCTDSGVAVIPIHGPMMKAQSKFGGASTVAVRRLLSQSLRDPDVKARLLHIDSPGGHVAGTQELANDVYETRSRKPIFAHIDDTGASGAYWVASQAQRITANPTAEIGSNGTVAVLTDDSGRMERLGVKVHVISTGDFKGVGAPGSRLRSEDLDYIRERVENLNEHFQESIQRGRKVTLKQLAEMSDGRVHIAAIAQRMGMIDEIMSFEQALERAGNYSLRDFNHPRAEERTAPLSKRHAQTLAAFRQLQGV